MDENKNLKVLSYNISNKIIDSIAFLEILEDLLFEKEKFDVIIKSMKNALFEAQKDTETARKIIGAQN